MHETTYFINDEDIRATLTHFPSGFETPERYVLRITFYVQEIRVSEITLMVFGSEETARAKLASIREALK